MPRILVIPKSYSPADFCQNNPLKIQPAHISSIDSAFYVLPNYKNYALRVSYSYRCIRPGLMQARTLAHCPRNYEKHAPRVSQVIAAVAKVSCKHGLWLVARVKKALAVTPVLYKTVVQMLCPSLPCSLPGWKLFLFPELPLTVPDRCRRSLREGLLP